MSRMKLTEPIFVVQPVIQTGFALGGAILFPQSFFMSVHASNVRFQKAEARGRGVGLRTMSGVCEAKGIAPWQLPEGVAGSL